VVSLNGVIDEEIFQPTLDTLTITRNTPAAEGMGTQTNLLTVNFTGELLAGLGGDTAQLTGQTALGDTVNYSSDFVNLSAHPADFSLGFTSWTALGDGAGVEYNSSTGFLNPSTAAGTGSFDISAVPEPTVGAILGAGVIGMMAKRRRVAR
jgi:hypothetical protein